MTQQDNIWIELDLNKDDDCEIIHVKYSNYSGKLKNPQDSLSFPNPTNIIRIEPVPPRPLPPSPPPSQPVTTIPELQLIPLPENSYLPPEIADLGDALASNESTDLLSSPSLTPPPPPAPLLPCPAPISSPSPTRSTHSRMRTFPLSPSSLSTSSSSRSSCSSHSSPYSSSPARTSSPALSPNSSSTSTHASPPIINLSPIPSPLPLQPVTLEFSPSKQSREKPKRKSEPPPSEPKKHRYMTRDSLKHQEYQVEIAIQALKEATAILVVVGGQLGHDSEITDYCDVKQWDARFPHLKQNDFYYDDAWNSKFFTFSAHYNWTFWWDVLQSCRQACPAEGLRLLLEICESKLLKHGYFIYTDAFDGMFTKVGFSDERLLEYRGSVHYAQHYLDHGVREACYTEALEREAREKEALEKISDNEVQEKEAWEMEAQENSLEMEAEKEAREKEAREKEEARKKALPRKPCNPRKPNNIVWEWDEDFALVKDEHFGKIITSTLPHCPKCGENNGLLRPNVLLEEDLSWLPHRRNAQLEKYHEWIKSVKENKGTLVILEIGDTSASIGNGPGIRNPKKESEACIFNFGAKLICIGNDTSNHVQDYSILTMGTTEALRILRDGIKPKE